MDIQATGQGPVHAWQARATYDGRPAKANVIRKAKDRDVKQTKPKGKPGPHPSPPPTHQCGEAAEKGLGGQVVPENPARGSAGSERHVVQRPLVEPGDSPQLQGPLRLRRGETPAPLSPHTSVRGGSGEGARRSSSPRESSGGKCRLGAPRRAAPVGRTRRQPPAQRALEAPPGRDPGPSSLPPATITRRQM